MKRSIIHFLIILFLFLLIGCNGRNVDYQEINYTDFQREVLDSQLPVLALFCSDELWSRKSVPWSRSQPSPVILAVKEIIRNERYKSNIKLWKYMVPEGSYNQTTRSFDKDSFCSKFNIKWLPTLIIFRNGKILKKFEGGGCTVDESKTKIINALQKVGELQ